MKTLLWLAGALGVIAASAVVVSRIKPRHQLRAPLALAGVPAHLVGYEIVDAEIIEIEPLDNFQPLDAETVALLEHLSDRALFMK
ncbi:MAG TPA: hypothetical protein VGC41_23570 [Kofleriaceae bacterium]